mmetsp:Transcript_13707/g.30358  ORF Transcript_13707/g.30358 Transcript_13707/m.30358 type:complete len:580 (+) Transcript_13707:162-1901(+)
MHLLARLAVWSGLAGIGEASLLRSARLQVDAAVAENIWIPISTPAGQKTLYFNPALNEVKEALPRGGRQSPAVAMLQDDQGDDNDNADDQSADDDSAPQAAEAGIATPSSTEQVATVVAPPAGAVAPAVVTAPESQEQDGFTVLKAADPVAQPQAPVMAAQQKRSVQPSSSSSSSYGDQSVREVNHDHDLHEEHKAPDYGSCVPHCYWKCSNPICDQKCKPRCAQPKCQTRCLQIDYRKCAVECKKPKCTLFCPKDVCNAPPSAGNCTAPQCDTQCAKPQCNMNCKQDMPCESICQKPICTWDCKEPTECKKPDCQLVCEKPQTCKVVQYPLPGLANGASVQAEFKADVADWDVGDWSSCSQKCGHGYRTRTVQCSMGADHRCVLMERPASKETCEGKTGCGPPCHVRLYGDDNFAGWNVSLQIGKYDKAELATRGGAEDDISSVIVRGPCCRAALFEHDKFNKGKPAHRDGWKAILKEGRYTTADLEREGAKDDDTSSVHVYNDEQCLAGVPAFGFGSSSSSGRTDWIWVALIIILIILVVLAVFFAFSRARDDWQHRDDGKPDTAVDAGAQEQTAST